MKVYVASSWRNPTQPEIIEAIRAAGHEVYDFRHPKEGDSGFHWSEIDDRWIYWTPAEYVRALDHPIAKAGFKSDFDAMQWADVIVMVQPCGRSAHLELGWACGAKKRTCILLRDGEPELMVLMVDKLVLSVDELLKWLESTEQAMGETATDETDTVATATSKGTETATKCPTCDGCGNVADDEDQTPWSFWEALPPGTNAAMVAGLVQPKPCPDCGGIGTAKQ